MSKLAPQDKFFDLSDYGRLPATIFAQQLKKTAFTPIHVTLLFGVVGLLAAFCILKGYFWQAGVLLILKSIIDAADGELARIKNTPSYTGRYLDSVFDFILNFIFLICIDYTFKIPLWITLGAFVSIELQGTLYNYYYLILRYISIGGDVTSKIFEVESPVAFPNEEQKWVNLLFFFYTIFYRIYDKIIHFLDTDAYKSKGFPNWFMTLVSMYGLGFHLLIMAFMLAFGLGQYISVFFIGYNFFIIVLIGIRKRFIAL